MNNIKASIHNTLTAFLFVCCATLLISSTGCSRDGEPGGLGKEHDLLKHELSSEEQKALQKLVDKIIQSNASSSEELASTSEQLPM